MGHATTGLVTIKDGIRPGWITKKVPFGIKNLHLTIGKAIPKVFSKQHVPPNAGAQLHAEAELFTKRRASSKGHERWEMVFPTHGHPGRKLNST